MPLFLPGSHGLLVAEAIPSVHARLCIVKLGP
jgi:hypothetical protein